MRVWLLVLPLLTAGCFDALLGDGQDSTLSFTCALLDPANPNVVVESYLASGASVEVAPLLSRLVEVLANATGRGVDAFSIRQQAGPPVPEGGWTRTRLTSQMQPFLRQGTVTLRVLWVDSMQEPATGMVAGPGTVAVALDSVAAGAQRIGHPVEPVALAVLLHQVGHALGLVNQGVPVQDPALQEREGPPGHNRDPAAVLNANWDDARTLTWAANATYDGFLAADLADWRASRQPGGVCT